MVKTLRDAKLGNATVNIGQLVYNPVLRELSNHEHIIHLEPRTIELLEFLLNNVGNPTSSDKILNMVWESDYISRNVISNRISDIRSIIKKYDSSNDPYKVLVTYPKKGYYFSKEHVFTSGRVKKKHQNMNRLLYLLFSFCLAILLSLYFFHKFSLPTTPSNKNPNLNISRPIRANLLLNKINPLDDFSEDYLIPIKASIFNLQLNNNNIYLTNKESPFYFLTTFSNDHYWPGAQLNSNKRYILNMQLKRFKKTNNISLRLIIVNSKIKKPVHTSTFIINTKTLPKSITNLNKHINTILGNNCNSNENQISNIIELTQRPMSKSISEIIGRGYATEVEVNYFTPYILSSPFVSNIIINKWISTLKSRATTKVIDTNLWLALLYYRTKKFSQADLFFSEANLEENDNNAFIFLVKSNIALHLEEKDQFITNYLNSISSLTKLIPPKSIYSRLSELNTSENCLSPWVELTTGLSVNNINSLWLDSFSDFCYRANEYLIESPSSNHSSNIS